jgi:hypothetical protein
MLSSSNIGELTINEIVDKAEKSFESMQTMLVVAKPYAQRPPYELTSRLEATWGFQPLQADLLCSVLIDMLYEEGLVREAQRSEGMVSRQVALHGMTP